VAEVLADWTAWLGDELDGIPLFDLPSGDTIYRVFLLPDGLQVDISFTPAARFAAGGPRFRLLFGELKEKPPAQPPNAQELFGWAVAYARDGRATIERGRLWMAEFMISAVRDNALSIACLRRGLPTRYGRGYDDLPPELLASFAGSLVRSLDRAALMRALSVAVEGLLRESAPVLELAERVAPSVRAWLADEATLSVSADTPEPA
jgi:hypothetical protein